MTSPKAARLGRFAFHPVFVTLQCLAGLPSNGTDGISDVVLALERVARLLVGYLLCMQEI
jgi:hypothetical protein